MKFNQQLLGLKYPSLKSSLLACVVLLGFLKELSPLNSSALTLSSIFADKPLTSLCCRTIVQKSLVVETKDFLILALS